MIFLLSGFQEAERTMKANKKKKTFENVLSKRHKFIVPMFFEHTELFLGETKVRAGGGRGKAKEDKAMEIID